jgi:hypothetical protein
MSNHISSPAADARETARQGDGKFGQQERSESGVTLGINTDAAAAKKISLDKRIEDIRLAGIRLRDLDMLTYVRDQARETYGEDVTSISLDEDEGSLAFYAHDADGDELDEFPFAEGFEPLSGAPLPANLWAATGDHLTMIGLDSIDLEKAVEAEESSISTSHIGRTAIDSFVVDRGYVMDTANDHISEGWELNGTLIENDLTDEETEKVAQWFEKNYQFGDRLHDDYHQAVDEALEEVLSETRGL